MVEIPHNSPSPIVPTPQPISGVRRSVRTKKLTEKGAAWTVELEATQVHLKDLQECRAAAAEGGTPNGTPSEGVRLADVDELRFIEPSIKVPEVIANIVIEEQAHITIRSDKRRNPLAPDYDMSIPPATHDKAIQRSDRDEWLTTMKTELQMMKEMQVYKVANYQKDAKRLAADGFWSLRQITKEVRSTRHV
jgi:hypothetical protein